jgi:hypothetical protein
VAGGTDTVTPGRHAEKLKISYADRRKHASFVTWPEQRCEGMRLRPRSDGDCSRQERAVAPEPIRTANRCTVNASLVITGG